VSDGSQGSRLRGARFLALPKTAVDWSVWLVAGRWTRPGARHARTARAAIGRRCAEHERARCLASARRRKLMRRRPTRPTLASRRQPRPALTSPADERSGSLLVQSIFLVRALDHLASVDALRRWRHASARFWRFFAIWPGVLTRFIGQAPVRATIYELQKLRCQLSTNCRSCVASSDGRYPKEPDSHARVLRR
jgi:hypothetical protein